jgi:EAL domain-containing protein (putative c-di-GMP-specific phosphodiesterase class I)/CheY-like chemotaxis protein
VDTTADGDDRSGELLGRHRDASVLVVDDQRINVELLERMLRSAGLHQVTTETDARRAVPRFLELQPDLVLLDLHMPHRDGFQVMADIRAALPTGTFLPIVILTGDVTHDVRDRALSAGATDFLTMPFDHVEVLLRVRNLLEARAVHTALQQHNRVLQDHIEARREDERRRLEHRRTLERRIDGVLDQGGIRMVYQPIADLRTGALLGVEALARFDVEPHRPPDEWFDEAASVDRGVALELVAVREALASLERVPDGVFLSINVSPWTAVAPGLVDLLRDAPAERIVLELTEHARVDDYAGLVAALDGFRGRGMRIAVDDAGAGYSGFRHVLRLRPDILKLDNFLTSGIDGDPARHALGTAMVHFAREIGATIVAEGIETSAELLTLRDMDVPWGQGYHLARPAPLPPSTLDPETPGQVPAPPASG